MYFVRINRAGECDSCGQTHAPDRDDIDTVNNHPHHHTTLRDNAAIISISGLHHDRYESVWGHGIAGLAGRTVAEAIPMLRAAISTLGTTPRSTRYSDSEQGAGTALLDLLMVAVQCDPSARLELI